jgi:hypothetical protein
MAMKNFKIVFMGLLMLLVSASASAQCAFKNTAFKSGEFLSYNLYYNWKFVWVKAGTASFSIVESKRNGKPAYRGSLITRGSTKVDKFFVMRDTLLCYNTLDLAPLYYRKGAVEGDRYTVDEVFYSYPNGKTQIKQHRQKHDGRQLWETHTYDDCVYDMMSMFLRARSFNPTGWKKGYNVDFPMVDGNSRNPARITYEGKVDIKADNGVTYRCLQLSYYENENDDGYKKIVDFFISDDENHIPVRLDMHLRFGSAKAFLVGMKGIRNPITSQVK